MVQNEEVVPIQSPLCRPQNSSTGISCAEAAGWPKAAIIPCFIKSWMVTAEKRPGCDSSQAPLWGPWQNQVLPRLTLHVFLLILFHTADSKRPLHNSSQNRSWQVILERSIWFPECPFGRLEEIYLGFPVFFIVNNLTVEYQSQRPDGQSF